MKRPVWSTDDLMGLSPGKLSVTVGAIVGNKGCEMGGWMEKRRKAGQSTYKWRAGEIRLIVGFDALLPTLPRTPGPAIFGRLA
jgi:hypothetical protein